MKVLFAGQVPKEPDFPDDMEDVLERTPDDSLIVISDGASESFDSKTWARLLTAQFINHSELSQTWLIDVIADYITKFDYANLSWSKQAAFARGSFATLLAIDQSAEHDTVNIFSVGDSLAVFLDDGKLLRTFPYVRAEEFQQRPELLCTNFTGNAFLNSPTFPSAYQKTWFLQGTNNPVILCMTDALGEWALRHWQEGDPRWQQLTQIREVTEFEDFVMRERAARTLRVDDTTLISLSFFESEKHELPNA